MDWLDRIARCRRLAMVTTDAKARETLNALITEYEAAAAQARTGMPEASALRRVTSVALAPQAPTIGN